MSLVLCLGLAEGSRMAKPRKRKGEMSCPDEPFWEPLLGLVGFEVTGDFMYMFQVEMRDGTKLHAYKHRDTRRYIHLTDRGEAWYYEEPDWYRPCRSSSMLLAVFRNLRELGGVTERQVEASHKAYERAADHDDFLEYIAEREAKSSDDAEAVA